MLWILLFSLSVLQRESKNPNKQRLQENLLQGSITGFSPAKAPPHRRFELTLEVTERWNSAFYFKFDDGEPIEGFLNDSGQPTVIVEGLSYGEKFIYISPDRVNWSFVGTLQIVDTGSYWTLILVFVGAFVIYYSMKIAKRMCRRYFKKKRSDSGTKLAYEA